MIKKIGFIFLLACANLSQAVEKPTTNANSEKFEQRSYRCNNADCLCGMQDIMLCVVVIKTQSAQAKTSVDEQFEATFGDGFTKGFFNNKKRKN